MGYGGALIFSGLARNLKQKFPDKKIVFIYTRPWRGQLHEHAVYDHNPDIWLVIRRSLWLWVKYFYRQQHLIVVDLNNPAYQYWTQDTPERIVFKQGAHAIHIACAVHGITATELKPKIRLTAVERARADRILRHHHLAAGHYICLEPHSKTDFTPNRAWFWDRWQSVVHQLNRYVRQQGLPVQIVQIGERGSRLLSDVVDLTGSVTFRETARLLEQARFFIGTEGGLLHLAAAVDTVSVALLSTSQQVELVAYPQNRNLVADAAVCPCRGLKTPCRFNRRCMQQITVAQVIAACRRLLK